MTTLTFFGAAGTVTGSCYFLSGADRKGILIDWGLFQGSREVESFNYETLPLHPTQLTGVFLTHAHLDHAGKLPMLRKFGYRGNFYMTDATKALLELTLLDAMHVQKENNEGRALYNEEDIYWVLRQTIVVKYEESVRSGHFQVMFRNAGHILGSAFLEIHNQDNGDAMKKIIFSGDLGNYPEPLVQPTEFPHSADVVVMESTYGDRAHHKEDPFQVLQEEINAIEQHGGTLLVPAFSIERTQELLHLIDHLKKNKRVKDETHVFLDTTLGIKVTRVYEIFGSLYNDELRNHQYNDDPFDFPGLIPIEKARDSILVDAFAGPKVIIAGSGMMSGGRILRHAKEYLPRPDTRIVFVGFQADGSIGRQILDGATDVWIDGEKIPVRATVRKSSGLSSHADQPKLLRWLSGIIGVQQICLTHGETLQRTTLAGEIRKVNKATVHLPLRGDTLHLGKESNIVYEGSSAKRKGNPDSSGQANKRIHRREPYAFA